MNREIKFRGKRKDNGEWVKGYYVKFAGPATGENHFIHTLCGDVYQVDPATVGQQTGLKDKNGKGKECYRDDLMQLTHISFADCCLTKIVWDDEGRWVLEHEGRILCSLYDGIYKHSGEVIGNLHKHSEFLEESE